MELALALYEEITGTTPLPTIPGEDSDRRKHRRMPFGFRATIQATRKGVEGPASVVMIRDMSLAGISFLNEDALKSGTSFVIEFKSQRDRPVKIRCTTVRCEQGGMGGTQYVIGSTFDELLTKELPPLPKEEPLPPLSDQSHIRGRLIRPASELPISAADAMAEAAHEGPAPHAPFSVTSQPEPDQPMVELTRVYGRLIRPNSEFEKAARPLPSPHGLEPLHDQGPVAIAESDESQPIGMPPAAPMQTAAAHASTASTAPASATNSNSNEPLDEEAQALAMLLAEPDDDNSFEGFTIEEDDAESLNNDTNILEMLAEAGAEKKPAPEPEPEPEIDPAAQARILGRLTKSEPVPEKKLVPTSPATPTAQTKTPEPTIKAEPKVELATPSSEPAKILDRLTKSDAELEKKSASVAAAPIAIASAKAATAKAADPAPKSEPENPVVDQAKILGRLHKTETEADKKPAPAAAPVAAAKTSEPAPKPALATAAQPAVKASSKVESENTPAADHARISKSEAETEKKPATAPVAPTAATTPKAQPQPIAKAEPATKVEHAAKPEAAAKAEHATKPEAATKPEVVAKSESVAKTEPVTKHEPIAKSAPKAEPAASHSEPLKLADKLTKPSSEPEIKRVPQVTASEDAAAAKPAVAKAPPAAPAAPPAPSWSIASKPTAPAEQKPVVISRSQGKGVNAMSLTHTDSTAEHAPKSDVVAGVKTLLLQQRETLKKQEHELETLRNELAQAKRKTAQLQAKADADEKAMTELEAFLAKEGGDATHGENESVAA